MGLTAWIQNVRERERECAIFVSENVKEWESVLTVSQNGESEFLEDKSIYKQSLSCSRVQMRGTKSKLWM